MEEGSSPAADVGTGREKGEEAKKHYMLINLKKQGTCKLWHILAVVYFYSPVILSFCVIKQ
jgi:hypothetical protein